MKDYEKYTCGGENGEDLREYRFVRMPVDISGRYALKFTPLLKGLQGLSEASDTASRTAVILDAISKTDTDEIYDIAMKVLRYETFAGPEQIKLSDNMHFENWFRKYPQDLMHVAAFAISYQCMRFFVEPVKD